MIMGIEFEKEELEELLTASKMGGAGVSKTEVLAGVVLTFIRLMLEHDLKHGHGGQNDNN